MLSLFAMDATATGRKKSPVLQYLTPVVFALLLILNCIDNPRLAGLRVIDLIRLLAVGMCIGVPLGIFAGRRSRS